MALCAFNFGYDVGTFGVQGMQSFEDDFGVYNEKTGQWELQTYLRSVMISTPFIGKALVSLSAIHCCYALLIVLGRRRLRYHH